MRTALLLGAGAVALAMYACGACTRSSETGSVGAGGKSGTNSTKASSIDVGSTASAAGGGGGGCAPVPPPPGIPEGWKEFSDWSCGCRFYYPPDPKAMAPPITWVPCPEKPNGIDCRAMKVDWTSKLAAIAVDVSFDRSSTGVETLQFRRNVDPATPVWLQVEVDGPVRSALARVWNATKSDSDIGCFLTLEQIREGKYVLGVAGDSSVSPEAQSPHRGAVGGSIDDPVPHLLAHYTDGLNRNWRVSSTTVMRVDTTFSVYASPWSMDKDVLVTRPDIDPGGAPSSQWLVVGGAVFWGTSPSHPGINVYDPAGGARPFIRFLGDSTKGAMDLGTDGTNMVWTYGEGVMQGNSFPVRSVTTAPFTTDAKVVAASQMRLRSAPEPCIGCDQWLVGCGYAAHNGDANNVIVVRLSDGWSWFVPTSLTQSLERPVGIDCQDVFIFAELGQPQQFNIARVRLDSLGAGMPPD